MGDRVYELTRYTEITQLYLALGIAQNIGRFDIFYGGRSANVDETD